MTTHFWLRAETNPNERRTPLTPEDAEKLVQQGVKVTVEKSGQRTFSDDQYQKVGCTLAEPNTWMNEAPLETVILGLGPLAGTFPLNHRHIYFGHAFKNQFGWRDLLTRFLQGGGALLDIEYIVNEQGHRLASFGNIAGYTGMAAGVLAWCRQELMEKSIQIPSDMIRQFENLPLLEHLKALLNTAVTFSRRTPNIVVVGANGIVGRGAISLAEQLGLPVTKWTREQTAAEGPYADLLQFDILLNAIKLDQQVRSPFLTEELIRSAGRQLSVVVDVSCDYQNPKNPLPIYHQPTTFDKPTLRVLDKPKPLDVIAIPTLPSLLPTESSKDFSKQLLPHLLTIGQPRNDVWTRVEGFFLEKIATISPVPLSRTQHPELHCTWHQERLWKLHQVDTSAYNIAKAIKVDKQVSLTQLSAVVSQLLSESEILRTTFEFNAQKQRLMQTVHTTVDMSSVVSQVQSTHEPQSAEFQALLTHHIATPFNIERLPLVRVVLCQTSSASVVLVVMHQIVADEQSLSLFVEKLCGKTAAGAGHHALQYGDYSHWDYARWLTHSWAGDEMSPTDEETWEQAQIHYWKEKLNGSLHVLQLPIDYPRPPVQGFDCVKSVRQLPLELTQKLRKFSERISSDSNNWNGLFISLLTAFKIILYRFTLEEDIIVTTKFSGRTMAMYRQLLGTFANQLVLRTPVADNLSFQQLLEQVQQTFEQALAHRDVPFERVLEELYGKEEGGARIAHAPISQVQINLATELEKAPLPERFNGEIASQAVNVETVTLHEEKSPLDLTVTISGGERDDEPIKVELLYNKNLFFAVRMEELHSQLELLLTQILANPSENIVNYTFVTERAKGVLPVPEKPIDGTWRGAIYDHFSRNARATPDRVAVVYENKPITYGVLEKWTNKLSNYLISSGIKPEDVIAIYGHRSPPVVVAIMGILKAGAAYTMMDPIYPTERIQQCLDIAKPRGWVGIGAAGALPSDLQEYLNSLNLLLQLSLPAVDALANDAANPLAQAAETYPNVEVGPDSLAVVTFTSGSTGIPKGVMGRHVSLTHFYPWMSQRFEFGPDDRFSMCSGIAHDPLQRDIFTPLFFGAPVYIPTQETINEPGRLAEWMKENEINVTCMTPALGQLLTTVDNPSFTIDSLKNAFFVGDLLIKRDVYRLRRLCPNVRCINMYGSTETQRSVGYFVVPGDEILKDMKEVIPVGVGMQDVDLLILNSRGKLAGVGEAAEIYVRSHHLARGYIALEEQTKAKFLQNPFTNIPGDRMYRTGDLGRYASDGSLECMGRADDQVKIRGFRIELGEINAVLSKHPTVKENVTIVREDKPGDKQLVSYIVPTEFDRDGNKVSSIDIPSLCKELKQFLAGKLPHYMVPVHIVVLQTMPLTPNGKINRPGLPAPQKGNSDLNDGTGNKSLRPLTEQEQSLIQLWSKVLGVEVTNPDESFFELGGHSLLATRLTFEIRNEFQTDLPMQLLFKAPTVTSMARAIERVKQGKPIEDEDLQKKERETQAQFLESEVATLLKDPELTLPSNIAPVSTAFNNILLTGGTGFLGAFLLRDLLARAKDTKDAAFKVYCLVRAVNEEEAMVRLKNNLQGHLLWEDWYEPHIVALPGDLAKELLGLTPTVFADLASKIDLIVHNGAYVHWLQPYDRLKATNVLGTLAVLKLASKTRLKPVHYVSTTSVYESDYHQNLKTVYEDDPFTTSPLGLSGGYPQTKWVAEKLVLAARARGIPVSIYRPGYVSGDTVNGIWNTDDFICRLIKGCIQLGAAPDLRAATLDMSPVDFVTESITNCAFDASALNKSFNVVNSNLYSFNKLFTSMHSFGYNVELIDYAAWRQKLVQATAAAENDNALSSMVTFFTESWADGLQNRPKTDNRNLHEARKNAVFPEIDNVLLTYFSYLIQCGFIEPPLRAPNNNLNINWKIISDGVQMLTRTNRHK